MLVCKPTFVENLPWREIDQIRLKYVENSGRRKMEHRKMSKTTATNEEDAVAQILERGENHAD